ncbi:MAG: response regulator [Polyangiaceae bacterium]
MRVLLVDDEGSLLLTLAANLELEGFEVALAGSGEAALEIITREPFDLVLTDIRMPGMNGVELFHRVRRLRPEMPVVLMTAFAVEELVDQALSSGAFTVLPKPFSIEQVVATISHAARRPLVLVVDGGEAQATASALLLAGVPARAASRREDEQGVLAEVTDGRIDICVVPLVPGEEDVAALVSRLLAVEPALTFVAVGTRSAPAFAQRMAALRAFACLREPLDVGVLARVCGRARGARVGATSNMRFQT